jgi:hypothetical protein
MNFKGNQRANGAELAHHLMKSENEIVEVAELRGFASDGLRDAFLEIQAISRATQCVKYLYSLSLNPPSSESVTREDFEITIERAEQTLGLAGQPRAVVYHTKNGRTHCHVVWSRIDIKSLKAIKLNFPKRKLKALSIEIFNQFGWELPAGYLPGQEANPMNYTYQEYQEAKRGGKDAKRLKINIKNAWSQAEDLKSFESALERNGLFLAKGDRRAFVCVDYEGNTYSLSRWVGQKTKEIEERLGDPTTLRDVQETQALISERMTPQLLEYIEEATEDARLEMQDFEQQRQDMAKHHRAQRSGLKAKQFARWEAETKERSERFSSGLKGLWHRVTGKHQRIVSENEQHVEKCLQRDIQEQRDLRETQSESRSQLQSHIDHARSVHQDQLEALYAQIHSYQTMANDADTDVELRDQINHHRAAFEQAVRLELDH